MWTALTTFVLSIFGIYKNADGQYIDYKEKELQELECIYTDPNCALDLENNKYYIQTIEYNNEWKY